MGANRLDIVFVLPGHGRENLERTGTGGVQKKGKRQILSLSSLKILSFFFFFFYQPLIIFHSLRARDGGLADGLADGLCLKLRTCGLSVPIFVPLSFQPVGFNLDIPLENERD